MWILMLSSPLTDSVADGHTHTVTLGLSPCVITIIYLDAHIINCLCLAILLTPCPWPTLHYLIMSCFIPSSALLTPPTACHSLQSILFQEVKKCLSRIYQNWSLSWTWLGVNGLELEPTLESSTAFRFETKLISKCNGWDRGCSWRLSGMMRTARWGIEQCSAVHPAERCVLLLYRERCRSYYCGQ